MKKALFQLGQVVITPGALRAFKSAQQGMVDLLGRHVRGDWGDICEEDTRENELSLEQGFRLMSVYTLRTGVKIWIITEAGRSVTTLLLPDEY